MESFKNDQGVVIALPAVKPNQRWVVCHVLDWDEYTERSRKDQVLQVRLVETIAEKQNFLAALFIQPRVKDYAVGKIDLGHVNMKVTEKRIQKGASAIIEKLTGKKPEDTVSTTSARGYELLGNYRSAY